MLRRATLSDLSQLAALEYELFDNSLSEAALERELAVGFGYVIGDLVRAYALVRRDGELLDLTRLGVSANCQGKGLGAQLLQRVISLGSPVMLTVKKQNERALRLYRAHDFYVVGHFSEPAAWVLRRDADPSARPAGA